MFKNLYKRNLFFLMIQCFIAPFLANTFYAVPENEGGSVNEQKEREKAQNELIDKIKKTITEQTGEFVKKSDVETLVKGYDNLKEAIANQGNIINELKLKGEDLKEKRNAFEVALKGVMDSAEFKDYLAKGARGVSAKFDLKAVNLTSNYTGTILINQPSGFVLDVNNRRLNLRDVMTVVPTSQPSIVGQEVFDWTDKYTNAAAMNTENGTLAEGGFYVRENTWTVKRIGAYTKVSKRMLNTQGLAWLQAHLLNVLPKKLKWVEDFQILFGDGSGNNLTGIKTGAQQFTTTGATISAHAVESVATYNSGVDAIVTTHAASPHNFKNGDVVTIANATAPRYNAAFTVKIINANQFIITPAGGYTAEADTSAWTATSKLPFSLGINYANEIDVLRVAKAYLTRGEYTPTAIVLNPTDVAAIQLLKSTTAEYLRGDSGAVVMDNGFMRIFGMYVIETTAMSAGEFIIGDFSAQSIELAEFTPVSIQFADDVTYKLNNQVAVIVEEEVILPIFNPSCFMFGNFTAAKALLETT